MLCQAPISGSIRGLEFSFLAAQSTALAHDHFKVRPLCRQQIIEARLSYGLVIYAICIAAAASIVQAADTAQTTAVTALTAVTSEAH